MIKPDAIHPDEQADIVGYIFDAPVMVKGRSWYPLAEVLGWFIMAVEAGRLHPERQWLQRSLIACATTPVILGSEWCHNLAHAATAKLVGHPTDAIRVTWGMPLLVYHDIEDDQVMPKQHIIRSLGGPLINLILWGIGKFMHRFTREGTASEDILNALIGTNAFLGLIGMVPQPWLDGGAALKWVLVAKGKTREDADKAVQGANYAAAAGLGAAALAAFKKQWKLVGGVLAFLSAISIGTALGLLREKS